MIRQFAIPLLAQVVTTVSAARAEEIVIDFEQAKIGKPVPTWTEKDVVFNLAGPLTQSKAPADPIPLFQLTVKAHSIAAIRFSGPRNGEFLAADEVRFTTVDAK